MPFKYQPVQPDVPEDPLTSRDIRFGVNLSTGNVETGKLGDIPKELQYDPIRDSGNFAGSTDPLSFVASVPFRGIGAVGAAVGQGMSGVSDFLNNIGPVKAYGETVGNPIGEVGKTVLDWIGGPGRFVQDIAARVRLGDDSNLPADILRMKQNGVDEDTILQLMRDTNRSFSDDPMINLGASLLLDPLNFTPFVMGKVGLVSALTKVAGAGAGAAAGSFAGGVGAIGGAFAGYKAGSTVAAKLPSFEVGLDLSRKIRAVQAEIKTGKELAPWMKKYETIANIHEGLFGKISGVSDGIKAAFAVKISEIGDSGFFPGAWSLVNRSATLAFDSKRAGVAVRRGSVGFQQTILSSVKEMVSGGIDEAAASKTEQFVSDINAAQKQLIENGNSGTASEIAKVLRGDGSVQSTLLSPAASRAGILIDEVPSAAKRLSDFIRLASRKGNKEKYASEPYRAGLVDGIYDDIVSSSTDTADAYRIIKDTNIDQLRRDLDSLVSQGKASQAEASASIKSAIKKFDDAEALIKEKFGTLKDDITASLGDLIENTGSKSIRPSVVTRYGVGEDLLETQVSDFLDQRGVSASGGQKFAYPDRNIDIWKKRRTIALTNRALEDLTRGKDWQKTAQQFAKDHSDQLARKATGVLQESVTRESGFVGSGGFGNEGTTIVSEQLVEPMTDLANSIARSGGETLSNVGKAPGATDAQIAVFSEEWLSGAKIVGGPGARKFVGGKYFDASGRVVANPIIQRELAAKIAWAQHIRFGYTVNRVGNIRRMAVSAAMFEGANESRKAAIRKEVSKLAGRQLTDEQISLLAKMKDTGVTRFTLLRNDNLLDTEVDRFLEGFSILDDAAATPSMLVSVGFSEADATRIINAGKQSVVRKREWAAVAKKQFADISSTSSISRGMLDPEEVYAILDSAKKNDAMFSVMKADEVESLRQFWETIGGSADEIDDIIKASYQNGYRLGIAPADNMMQIPVKVGVRNSEGVLIDQVLKKKEPFVDLTSDFIDGLPRVDGVRNTGFFSHNLRRMFSPVLQSSIISSARQRMLTSLGGYLSRDEIAAFDNAINERAASQRVGVRGLVSPVGNKSQIYNALDEVLRQRGIVDGLDGRLREAVSSGLPKLDIDNAVLRAYAGEIQTSGVSQWVTGQVKANGIPGLGMNKSIALLSENYYPTLKYALNPFFWLQEIIESPFFKEMRGLRTDRIVTSLRKQGLEVQDVRLSLGERGNAVAKNMHEAAFGTSVALRGGSPTVLAEGLEQAGILGMVKRIYNKKVGDSGPVDTIASYKEAQGDIMAVGEYAKKWANDVARNRPHEFSKLAEEFGIDELDMFSGWLAQHRRAQDIGFGDEVFDSIRPSNWGFAVNPSEGSLIRARGEARAFASYLEDDASIIFLAKHRPGDLVRTLKIRVLDEARLGGYDTNRLRQLTDDVETAAQELKYEATRTPVEGVRSLKGYAKLKQAVQDLVDETVDGLGTQANLVKTNSLILRRLFDLTGTPGKGPKFEAVLSALANGQKYGAKFNSLGSVVGEIYDRVSAGSEAFRGLDEAAKIQRIDAIVRNVLSREGTTLEVMSNRVANTLHDSAMRLLQDHGGEEVAFQSAKFGYQETARAMDRINYFNPDRGWLERTMNHQFLGLYPLSYMFGKVLPETFRFMFWKPFGAVAPGAGYQAYNKFIGYLSQNGFLPDFEEKGTERPDYLFFLTQLLPGTPEDITVGIPGWMRRGMSTISRQGYDQFTFDQLAGEIGKPLVDTGVFGAARMGISSLQELTGAMGQEDDQTTFR